MREGGGSRKEGGGSVPVESASERLFTGLLFLFPRRFRERFGSDMRELFRDQVRAARSGAGTSGIARLWLRTVPSFTHTVLLEWRDALVDTARRRRAATRNARHTPQGDGMLQTLTSDLRFSARMLRKSPVFTVVAVLVVSLGTGAVATIFSGMNAVVLRPLPGTRDGNRLVLFERRTPDFTEGISGSYRYYDYLRARARTLDGLAAWSKVDLAISARDQGHAVYGNIVSGNYFSVLGVRPALGRFFTPDEDRTPLAQPVVVVSHSFWESQLGGDSSAIGRAVGVNGHPFTLIGVAPPGFRGVFTPLETQAWVPLMMQTQVKPARDLENAPWLWMFGRLAPGATRADARRELTGLTAAWAKEAPEPTVYREYNAVRITDLTGLPDDARRAFLGFSALLLGGAGLVLLIACVNVASMLSARAIARRREMAVRSALGASRGRLVRQLVSESLVLFLLGAIGGVGVAFIATRALEGIPIPGDAPMSLELSPDPRVFVFALAVALASGLAFGLAPALKGVSKDITTRLRNDTAAAGARRGIATNLLIVGQLAFSLVLLVAAGLFVRALHYGAQVDPGFEIDGVATASLNVQSWGYDDVKARTFFRTLRDQVAATPGVTAVAYASNLPLAMSSSGDNIQVDGIVESSGDQRAGHMRVEVASVDVGYFDVVRIPIRRGRAFTGADDERATKVAIVNETLARRLSSDADVVGKTFGFHGDRLTIVGVARDAKYNSLSEKTPAFVYVPTAQLWRADQRLMVRTATDPAALAAVVRDAVRAIDPAAPPPLVHTLRDETSIVLFPQRMAAIVTGTLGLVGLLLAAVGLYGIIAYSVGRRTREIGVRVALGAQHGEVLGMVVREGMRLASTGVAVGIALAAATTRLITGFLFDVSPLDVRTFAGMSAVFVVVALVASYIPARRAAATDPLTALRSE